jgi:hypothetical protein
VGGGGRAHGQDVGQGAVGEGEAELGGIAVAGIGDHRPGGQAPLGELVEHVQRQAPLLPVSHRIVDPGSGPALADLLGQHRVSSGGSSPSVDGV